MTGKETMEFRVIDSMKRFEEGSFGVMEPVTEEVILPETLSADGDVLVIVPGLAFDGKGHRIGFGAGYYDRFIKMMNAAGVKYTTVGVFYEWQRHDAIPVSDHDVAVDVIVTEEGIYKQ